MLKIVSALNALFAIVLSSIIYGAYGVQFIFQETPCPLCMLQRIALIGVAIGPLLNLKFGVRAQHYGFSLISALFGASVSLRQIALHVCPGSPSFGVPILGLSLYSWAFIAFSCSVLTIAILMLLYHPSHSDHKKPHINELGRLAFLFVIVVAGLDVITTFMQCGMGVCKG